MADPLRNRDPLGNDPVNPAADPADPRYAAANDPRIADPADPRASHTIIDNSGRSGGSNTLVIGVVAAAIVVALLVFMNWTPGSDTPADPSGAVVEEPAGTAPAAPEAGAPAPAPAAPETEAPAANDTAPAPADEAPAPADDAAPATTEPAE